MSGIDTRHLFDLFVTADAGQVRVGDAPYGRRRIVAITGDRFEGDRLRGRILPGGADWILERSDGVLEMDVRMTLETDDGAFVYVTFRGFRHGPREVLDRIVRGEPVDPARTTSAPRCSSRPARTATSGSIASSASPRRSATPTTSSIACSRSSER